MKTAPWLERTAIDPESIVGTKWIGWNEFVGDRIMMEFVDKTNCIYTSKPRKYQIKYTVTEGTIFLSHIGTPFELRGQLLFNSGLPAFERIA